MLRQAISLAVVCALVPLSAIADGRFDLVGFASVEADGLATTTGGKDGATVKVSSYKELEAVAGSDDALVIQVSGTLTGEGMLRLGSNKTLIGLGSDATLEGFGLHISGKQNIIIRNLSFTGADDDAINVQEFSHHIWIDHCDFSNAYDGLVDIKRGSSWITVSWNRFFDHQKTCLLGHSDSNAKQDVGRLKVSYHHNWFQRTNSRHPRVRFGECHVYNNFYDGVTGYGVASTENADVVVEANYFLGVDEPTLVGYAASDPGDLIETNNAYVNSGRPQTTKTAFDPASYYSYAPDASSEVQAIVREGAGVAGFDPPSGEAFIRGNANGDLRVDVSDAVGTLVYLFRSGVLACHKAADVDDSGSITIADATGLLQFLFQRGVPPAAPYPSCGHDPTDDETLCESGSGC